MPQAHLTHGSLENSLRGSVRLGGTSRNITNLRITSVSKFFVKDAVELENGTKIENPCVRADSTEIDLAFALPEKQLDDDCILTRYYIPVKTKPNSDRYPTTMVPWYSTTEHAHTMLMDVRKVVIGAARFHGFVGAVKVSASRKSQTKLRPLHPAHLHPRPRASTSIHATWLSPAGRWAP